MCFQEEEEEDQGALISQRDFSSQSVWGGERGGDGGCFRGDDGGGAAIWSLLSSA